MKQKQEFYSVKMLCLITINISDKTVSVELIKGETQIEVINRLNPHVEKSDDITDLCVKFIVMLYENKTYGELLDVYSDGKIKYCFIEIPDDAKEFYFRFHKECLEVLDLNFESAFSKFEKYVLGEVRCLESPKIWVTTKNTREELAKMSRVIETGYSFGVHLQIGALPFTHQLESMLEEHNDL